MRCISICCAAILASLAVRAEPLAESPGYRGIWYQNTPTKDQYVYKYSGGFATYPQQHAPIAIYRREVDKTFFVFGGTSDATNRRPEVVHTLGCFDHATGTFCRPRVLLNKHTDDAHDNATLAIDDGGHLFVFCNAHGTARPSYVYRSTRPYDVTDFERVYEGNFSYGNPWYVPGAGFLLLHTHYEKGNEHRLFWMTSDDAAARTWSDRQTFAAMPRGEYQITWRDPRDARRIATAFDFHPGGLDTRTNLYYLETRDRGRTWRTAGGAEVKPPLTDPANAALVHDYQAERLNVYMKDLQFDPQGRPIVLYLTSKGARPGPANAPYQWWTARWTGDGWELRPFTTSDHNYDHGSLFVTDDGGWTVMAPTDPGPRAFATGGEMVLWRSADLGEHWQRVRAMTHDSPRNHTYLRRVLDGRAEFAALWADGDAFAPGESRLYFTDAGGEHVWRMPWDVPPDGARPEAVP